MVERAVSNRRRQPSGWISRRAATAAAGALALAATACQTQQQRLHDAETSVRSLQATAETVTEAWLARDTTDREARTILEQTQRLVEQQRSQLASTPHSLSDPQAMVLAQKAETLSRLIAMLWRDIGDGDAPAARSRMSRPPAEPSRPPQ